MYRFFLYGAGLNDFDGSNCHLACAAYPQRSLTWTAYSSLPPSMDKMDMGHGHNRTWDVMKQLHFRNMEDIPNSKGIVT